VFGKHSDESSTVVSLLAEHVRRDVSFGVLAPDTKLKIEDLRQRYGGSAHSLREALTLLSVEGLVEATAQKGYRVASATVGDLKDITRLRTEIECLGLRWAMKNGDIQWEGAIVASHHALSRAEADVVAEPVARALEWDEANRVFHAALIAACESPRLIEFQARLFSQGRRFRLAALREGQIDFEASRNDHRDLVGQVIAKDTESAIRILENHIERNAGG